MNEVVVAGLMMAKVESLAPWMIILLAAAVSGTTSQGDGPEGRHLTTESPLLDDFEFEDEEIESTLLEIVLNNTDPRLRPNAGGGPVNVRVGFYIISFGSVSEVNMDYQVNLFLRQYWQDKRMAFTAHNESLVLTAKGIGQVWTPDLFFTNEKKASFHIVTVPNKLMRIYPNGSIVYSVRLSLTLSCPMDLTHFPMDIQLCTCGIESYAYDSTQLSLKWLQELPVEMNPELELPQFDLVNISTTICLHRYQTGDFPCLKALFELERQYGFYLLQTFVPSMMIVVLSWVSFWINKDAVPARISLSVTTVLTMATQLSGSKASIPKVSYPKAIDIWMSVCMFFVFAALLEYAFVNTLSRKNKTKKKDREHDGDVSYQEKMPPSAVGNSGRLARILQWMRNVEAARLLDKISRVLFPGSFVLFNIIYWSIYLSH